MLTQSKAFLLWAAVAVMAIVFLIMEQPREPKHWLLVVVVVGSVALAVYSWKIAR